MLLFVAFLNFVLSIASFLPLKDESEFQNRFPPVTIGLIVTNVLIHAVFHLVLPIVLVLGGLEALLLDDTALEQFLRVFMLVPVDVLDGVGSGALSMVTAAFLHGDFWHLLGNMYLLFFFSRKVENLIGPWKFALFYMLCVFASGIGSVLGRAALPMTKGTIPALGASGALMGMIAAYLFLYSDQRIRTLITVFGLPIPFAVGVPAWVFILKMALRDALGSWLEQQAQAVGFQYSSTDVFAHLGGFAAGLLCVFLFLPAETLYYRRRYAKRTGTTYRSIRK
jgi:membrane associated rhomboid family serine protease